MTFCGKTMMQNRIYLNKSFKCPLLNGMFFKVNKAKIEIKAKKIILIVMINIIFDWSH